MIIVPTERFYRLPEAKKQTIRAAAMKEFARVPFEKASINQIIRTAEISRGSFYTYFEDKTDVVRYLFEESANAMKAVCRAELERTHGDFFAMLEALFEHSVASVQGSEDMMHVARHVFAYEENVKMIGMQEFPPPIEQDRMEGPVYWIFTLVDKERLRWKDFEHFASLVGMSMTLIAILIRQYYQYPDQLERIRQNFHNSVEVLRCGVYQESQNI